MDLELIKARRQDIEDNARCTGCGSTLTSCKANWGKDPTAPPWFGCCARGLLLDIPCEHVPSHAALCALLKEIESGEVRSIEEMLLDSIVEYPIWRGGSRLIRRPGLLADLHTGDYYAYEEI